MMQTSALRSTKLLSAKFLGSTTAESTLVKILKSSADAGVVAVGRQAVGNHAFALLGVDEGLDHALSCAMRRIQRSERIVIGGASNEGGVDSTAGLVGIDGFSTLILCPRLSLASLEVFPQSGGQPLGAPVVLWGVLLRDGF